MGKYKCSDEEFIQVVKENFSIREVLRKLGLSESGGSYKYFHSRIQKMGIDTSHFTGQAHLKGKNHFWNIKIPLEDILIENSTYSCTSSLRKRLVKEKVLLDECSRCHLTKWMGEEISLHLDHVDGNNTNNKIDNLRLLCPNCHSQTPTYCGRNKKKGFDA